MQNNIFYNEFTVQITNIREIVNINSEKFNEKNFNVEG